MSLSDPLEPPPPRVSLSEELEIALIDLVDGEMIEPATRAALVAALGGEQALERALDEARRGNQLAQNLSAHLTELTPSEGFVGAVLTQTKRRKRPAPTPPKARFWVELWALAISLTLLTTAWLALNALKKAQDRALQERLTPLPLKTNPPPKTH